MRYYCTKCGSSNVRKKTKSNYGLLLAIIDLSLFVCAFFTYGLTLLGCILIALCVKKKTLCSKCGCENCLVPMNTPAARAATRTV